MGTRAICNHSVVCNSTYRFYDHGKSWLILKEGLFAISFIASHLVIKMKPPGPKYEKKAETFFIGQSVFTGAVGIVITRKWKHVAASKHKHERDGEGEKLKRVEGGLEKLQWLFHWHYRFTQKHTVCIMYTDKTLFAI